VRGPVRNGVRGRPLNEIVRFQREMDTEKQIAERMTVASEAYVRSLMEILHDAMENCEPDAVARFKRCIGLVIGPMEMNLFDPLYKRFPEIEPAEHRDGEDET
jgi:hypothetical protein